MTADWLLLLFGLNFIGAACNTPTWWNLAVRSFGKPTPWRIKAVRVGLAFTNAALLFGCWMRASGAAVASEATMAPVPLIIGVDRDWHWITVNIPAQSMVGYLTAMFIGETLMILASADALRETGKRSICKPAFLVLVPLWIVIHMVTEL
ncbi:MAG: hypothetical protein H7267_12995 [Sandarakinorhabdus sp.]|nr:hypothetical protein [Sandarakinorhabdus sp.]